MRSKALNKVSTAQGGKCDVEKTCITWCVRCAALPFFINSMMTEFGKRRLGLTAFRKVFMRKLTVYKSLLKLLDFDLSQGRYRQPKRKFRGLVRSGMVVIDQLSF